MEGAWLAQAINRVLSNLRQQFLSKDTGTALECNMSIRSVFVPLRTGLSG
jgi:hypothetical protein